MIKKIVLLNLAFLFAAILSCFNNPTQGPPATNYIVITGESYEKSAVEITFDCNLDNLAVTTANITLNQGSTPVTITPNYIEADKKIRITFVSDLTLNVPYTLTLADEITSTDSSKVSKEFVLNFTVTPPGMPLANYRNRRIRNGSVISFSTVTSGSVIEIGTSSNTSAAAPDSWTEVSTYTFSETDGTELKVFSRAKKSGDYSTVFAKVYLVVDSYPPKAGDSGSQALHKDDLSITAWATGHTGYTAGTDVAAMWQTPHLAYGIAVGSATDIVCLGNGGSITMTFANGIENGTGNDFAVFENSFSDTFLEIAYIEVSTDGITFVRFDAHSLTAAPVSAFGTIDSGSIYGFAGTYKQAYGTPFDLEDLKYHQAVLDGDVDLNNIQYVRIVDILSGDGSSNPSLDKDSFNNLIYDPYKTTDAGGFDLDAVGIINEK